MQYRREIDGLRALAVLAVIGFHAGIQPFSGGFLGVDVFFVISGYLITSILLADKASGSLSLARFYERRARRILPALFFVVIATIVPAYLLAFPEQLREFGQSLVYISFFASNILFWLRSGYFGGPAEENPLLHTWSLAVEEQFYIVFPLLVIILWRLKLRALGYVLAIVLVASLSLAEFAARFVPVANFFLAPSRAWELLAGAIFAIAYIERSLDAHWSPTANNILSLFGLLLIVASFFMFDRNTPTPSLWTTIPVFGTALVLFFSRGDTIANRILGHRWLVGIGLISYSLYLWHQPLFAFARLRGDIALTPPIIAIVVLLTALLSVLTWKFVEVPFRTRGVLTRSQVFALSIVVSVLIAIAGYGLKSYDTFKYPYTEAQLAMLDWGKYRFSEIYRARRCLLDQNQVAREFAPECTAVKAGSGRPLLVWGDSHAASMSPGIRTVFDGTDVLQLTASACPPLIGFAIHSTPNCVGINEYVLRTISSDLKNPIVILAANWSYYAQFANFFQYFEQTMKVLDAKGIEAVVVGSLPQWTPSLPKLAVRTMGELAPATYLFSSQAKNLSELDQRLLKISLASRRRFIALIPDLCHGSDCLAFLEQSDGRVPMAWDYGHLTEIGSVHVAKILAARLCDFGSCPLSLR